MIVCWWSVSLQWCSTFLRCFYGKKTTTISLTGWPDTCHWEVSWCSLYYQLCSYSPFQFQNFEVRISPNYAQVGEVLRIFCEDLEEQIQHRRYFYKSSSLVHEGMIVVHNSGLTGDTTSATVIVAIPIVVDLLCWGLFCYTHCSFENLCWARALSKQASTYTYN